MTQATTDEYTGARVTVTGPGWELLPVAGVPMTDEFAVKWFGARKKGEWWFNKTLGIGAGVDHHGAITALFLFAAGVDKAKAFAGPLPAGLAWNSTQTDLRSKFGKPGWSGVPSDEPTTSIFHSPYPWDKWELVNGSGQPLGTIRIEFAEDGSGIRQVILTGHIIESRTHQLTVYSDYYQFYVCELTNTCDTGSIWDDPQTTERQLAVGDGLVAVGTKRYGDVPVDLEIYPTEPKLDQRGLDRVNECSLTIATKLGIGNPISHSYQEFDLAPGLYGVRLLYIFQNTVVSDSEGNDRYVVQLWPITEPLAVRYLKPAPKQSAPKKPAAKPAATKKTPAKKTAAKKTTAKKTAAKKA